MKRLGISGVVVVTIVAILAAKYYLGDRRDIRRQLDGLAQAATVNGVESDIERLGRAARVANFFTEDVVIRRSEDNPAFLGGRRAVGVWLPKLRRSNTQ